MGRDKKKNEGGERMRATVSISIEEQNLKVVYALMEHRKISRSEAVNFLILQGIARLKELNAEPESEGARE